mgnify:CR=1 FL=1
MTKYQKNKLIIFSVFGILLLIILYNYSRNGRYVFKDESSVILDTRTGTMYIPSNKTYLEIGDFKERNWFNKMKNILPLFLIVLLICSCNSSTKEKEPTKSKTEIDYEIADMFLEYDAEKIGLISIIKDIPHEKANSVLRDYLAKTYGSTMLTLENPEYVVKIIDTIARKNNLPKKITASIIFSYQYELITRDEIVEDAMDEMQEYDYEPADQY